MENNETIVASKFKPAGKRILVLPDPVETKSAGGVYLPETAQQRPQVGTIIAVGEDAQLGFKPGERVAFGKSAGMRIDFNITDDADDFKEHWLMQETELFGWL